MMRFKGLCFKRYGIIIILYRRSHIHIRIFIFHWMTIGAMMFTLMTIIVFIMILLLLSLTAPPEPIAVMRLQVGHPSPPQSRPHHWSPPYAWVPLPLRLLAPKSIWTPPDWVLSVIQDLELREEWLDICRYRALAPEHPPLTHLAFGSRCPRPAAVIIASFVDAF